MEHDLETWLKSDPSTLPTALLKPLWGKRPFLYIDRLFTAIVNVISSHVRSGVLLLNQFVMLLSEMKLPLEIPFTPGNALLLKKDLLSQLTTQLIQHSPHDPLICSLFHKNILPHVIIVPEMPFQSNRSSSLLDEFPSELLPHSQELQTLLHQYVQKKNQMDPNAAALALELKESFMSVPSGSLSSIHASSFDSLLELEYSFGKPKQTLAESLDYTDMPDVTSLSSQINLFQN